ncbi:metalloregulator ArsR/SmtB family transcription factor [Halomonas sp. SpR8]|uniref:ArsR/SmtB family transcription factor n=1 Tax=Halomonas sp. SpR8 TaxID=3050463 RepID=UPI0027E3D302|nr:metalloregulator ArsR/SmtB family transcription factor [Halomonas sp. SpR8]MDQ7727877.1 metalloregulator ArsR/SmtB family transcription factor [Halomonas sp. SpR8]
MTFCQSHVHESVAPDLVPSAQQLARTAALFKALGDPARLLLLYQLKDGERCVGELVVDGNKLSTVSARLQTLLNANLVKRRRDARHLYYRLADQHVVQLIENALAHADEGIEASE